MIQPRPGPGQPGSRPEGAAKPPALHRCKLCGKSVSRVWNHYHVHFPGVFQCVPSARTPATLTRTTGKLRCGSSTRSTPPENPVNARTHCRHVFSFCWPQYCVFRPDFDYRLVMKPDVSGGGWVEWTESRDKDGYRIRRENRFASPDPTLVAGWIAAMSSRVL